MFFFLSTEYEAVPRPTKQFRRQKVAAAAEWKKGNRKEATKLWADADKARKEFQAKKRNKNKPAESSEGGES